MRNNVLLVEDQTDIVNPMAREQINHHLYDRVEKIGNVGKDFFDIFIFEKCAKVKRYYNKVPSMKIIFENIFEVALKF